MNQRTNLISNSAFKFFVFTLFWTLFLAGSYLSASAALLPNVEISLDESFRAAMKRSETLSSQDEQLFQAQERRWQAQGSLFPQISGGATYFIQQSPSDPLTQSFFPSSQPTVKLTVTQALFRGLREFAVLNQMNHLSQAQENRRNQVLITLYSDVAQNFFDLMTYREELKNLTSEIALHEERIADLRKRAHTGQSSENEPLAASSAKATVQAQMKQVEAQYRNAQELFTFLTDLPQDSSLKYELSRGDAAVPIQTYLTAAEKRPDILAAQAEMEAYQAQVTSAKGEHLPTIDLMGNYYFVRPVGVFSDIKWDVQATVTLPIFSGGVIHSRVKEAASKKIQAELALTQTRRRVTQEIRTFYQSYQSNLEQVQVLQQAMELAERNYRVLKKDYARGLTRNLEVLQALTQFQENKRSLDRTRWTAQSNWVRLRILSTLQSPPSARN